MRLGFWTYIILITSTSFLFLLIGLYVFEDFNSSLGFVSLYIAFTSIAMAINSHFLAEDTDDRINEIANTHFLTIISSFEDRRLDIQKQIYENRKIDMHQIFLWKARVDLDKAKKISTGKCRIDIDSFDTLMSRFLGLMDTLIKIKDLLLCESVNNIMDIYNRIFDIVPKETLNKITDKENNKNNKERAEQKFRELLDIMENIAVDEELFKLISKITKAKNKRWKKYNKYKSQVIEEL